MKCDSCTICGGEVFSGEKECPHCGMPLPEKGAAWRRLETVFRGSMAEVLALQASLSADGFETFIPDGTIKTIDPFITGGNALEVSLEAPAESIPEIAEAIRAFRLSRPLDRDPEGGGGPEDDPSSSEAILEALEVLGRRIRWAPFILITAPVGFLWGIKYLARSIPVRPRPRFHSLTIAAFWLCLLETLTGIAFILTLIRDALSVVGP